MTVTSADLWKLDSYSKKNKDDLIVQLELMADELSGMADIDSLIGYFTYIEGFLDGLMFSGFITHFEHHDYLSPVLESYHFRLDQLDDSEVQT